MIRCDVWQIRRVCSLVLHYKKWDCFRHQAIHMTNETTKFTFSTNFLRFNSPFLSKDDDENDDHNDNNTCLPQKLRNIKKQENWIQRLACLAIIITHRNEFYRIYGI